jgi:hypothetical protein
MRINILLGISLFMAWVFISLYLNFYVLYYSEFNLEQILTILLLTFMGGGAPIFEILLFASQPSLSLIIGYLFFSLCLCFIWIIPYVKTGKNLWIFFSGLTWFICGGLYILIRAF